MIIVFFPSKLRIDFHILPLRLRIRCRTRYRFNSFTYIRVDFAKQALKSRYVRNLTHCMSQYLSLYTYERELQNFWTPWEFFALEEADTDIYIYRIVYYITLTRM